MMECTLLTRGFRICYGHPQTLWNSAQVHPQCDVQTFSPTLLLGVPATFQQLSALMEGALTSGGFSRTLFDLGFDLRQQALRKGFETPFINESAFLQPRQLLGGRCTTFLNIAAPLAPTVSSFLSVVCGVDVYQVYSVKELAGCGLFFQTAEGRNRSQWKREAAEGASHHSRDLPSRRRRGARSARRKEVHGVEGITKTIATEEEAMEHSKMENNGPKGLLVRREPRAKETPAVPLRRGAGEVWGPVEVKIRALLPGSQAQPLPFLGTTSTSRAVEDGSGKGNTASRPLRPTCGELLVRGPTLMCGYYRQPQRTLEALQAPYPSPRPSSKKKRKSHQKRKHTTTPSPAQGGAGAMSLCTPRKTQEGSSLPTAMAVEGSQSFPEGDGGPTDGTRAVSEKRETKEPSPLHLEKDKNDDEEEEDVDEPQEEGGWWYRTRDLVERSTEDGRFHLIGPLKSVVKNTCGIAISLEALEYLYSQHPLCASGGHPFASSSPSPTTTGMRWNSSAMGGGTGGSFPPLDPYGRSMWSSGLGLPPPGFSSSPLPSYPFPSSSCSSSLSTPPPPPPPPSHLTPWSSSTNVVFSMSTSPEGSGVWILLQPDRSYLCAVILTTEERCREFLWNEFGEGGGEPGYGPSSSSTSSPRTPFTVDPVVGSGRRGTSRSLSPSVLPPKKKKKKKKEKNPTDTERKVRTSISPCSSLCERTHRGKQQEAEGRSASSMSLTIPSCRGKEDSVPPAAAAPPPLPSTSLKEEETGAPRKRKKQKKNPRSPATAADPGMLPAPQPPQEVSSTGWKSSSSYVVPLVGSEDHWGGRPRGRASAPAAYTTAASSSSYFPVAVFHRHHWPHYLRDPYFLQAVAHSLNRFARERSGIAPFEQLRQVRVVGTEEWTFANGLRTATGRLNRFALMERYSDWVSEMFAEPL